MQTPSMELIAEWLARYMLIVLLCVTTVFLGLTALLWRVLEVQAPRLRRVAEQAWRSPIARTVASRVKQVRRVGPLLAGIWTVVRQLGALVILAFIAAIGGVVLFVEIADEIGADESWARFDVALSNALSQHLSGDLLQLAATVTVLGDPLVLLWIVAGVAGVLCAAQRWTLAIAWVAATSTGGLLNRVLKEIFERARPIHEHGLVSEASFSFPSGHAAGSLLVYGLLGYLIVRHAPRTWHVPIALATVTTVVFVGSSRILLQVHYLSDVIAGYVSSGVWLALSIAALETLRWRETLREQDVRSVGGGPD